MADRPGIHPYCGTTDCGTCRKANLTPGQVYARHTVVKAGKRSQASKVFRGPNAAKNLRDANAWKDRREGKAKERDLPKGMVWVTTRSGEKRIRATLPAWADEQKRARTFLPDELELAEDWMLRAIEALTAEPPLPLPEPDRSSADGSAPPVRATNVEAPPTMVGELVLRWVNHHYEVREEAKALRGDDKEKSIRSIVNRFIVKGNAAPVPADGEDDTTIIELGSVRLTEVTRKHFTNVLSRMAAHGYTDNQTRVCWVLRSSFAYGMRKGWLTEDVAFSVKPIPVTTEAIAEHRAGKQGRAAGRQRPPVPASVMAQLMGRVRDSHGLEYALAGGLEYFGTLRPGESLGFAMGDIDLERGLLEVTKQAGAKYPCRDEKGRKTHAYWVETVKSEASDRFVPIPAIFRPLIEEHYAKRIEEGAGAADAFLLGHIKDSQEAVLRAFQRAAEGLLEGNGVHAAFELYDLRHQGSTYYRRAGVEDDVRSYIVGHTDDEDSGMNRRGRRKAKGATITYRVYTHTYTSKRTNEDLTDWDRELIKAGQLLSDHIEKELAGLPVIAPPASTDHEDWMTYPEAQDVLGLGTHDAVKKLVQAGVLTGRVVDDAVRTDRGGHAVHQVLRRDVHALAERRAGAIGLATAASELGVDPVTLRRLMDATGIEPRDAKPEDGLGYVRTYITGEEFRLLSKVESERRRFAEDHISAAALGKLAGSRVLVQQLMNMGILEPVEPPLAGVPAVPPGVEWFDRETAIAAVKKRAKRKR